MVCVPFERKMRFEKIHFAFLFSAPVATATVAGGFVIEDVNEEECKGQGYEDPDTPAARELANDVAAMVNTSLNLSVK